MSRTLVYLVLLALVAVAVASGSLRVAITIAAFKSALVGIEYMELRHADRLHLLGFVGATLAMGGLLVVLV